MEGRACDRCRAGAWDYPTCEVCECEVKGTTEEICNQETAECFCKPYVEGEIQIFPPIITTTNSS